MSGPKYIYKPISKLCENGKYHGCYSVCEDGTRMLLSKGKYCYYATDDPFWKHAKDVDFKVETRSQIKKQDLRKTKRC